MKNSEKTYTLEIKALTFDVFGTVVDWRGSIIHEGEAFGVARGLDVDWAEFADRWRGGYGPSMNRVRKARTAMVEHRCSAPYDSGRAA